MGQFYHCDLVPWALLVRAGCTVPWWASDPALVLGSRFWFHVKPVFPPLPLRLLPVPETNSLPLTLVVSSEPFTWEQLRESRSCSHSYMHRFGHSVYSKLKYVVCTKYICVQAWKRVCEWSVYVVGVKGLFIKLIVVVMVMCYLHPYLASTTRTGAAPWAGEDGFWVGEVAECTSVLIATQGGNSAFFFF